MKMLTSRVQSPEQDKVQPLVFVLRKTFGVWASQGWLVPTPFCSKANEEKAMRSLVSILAVLAVLVVIGIGWTMWKMDVSKGEIGLATRYDAQHNVVETTLFKMRTTIKNIHSCTDEWADKFIKVVAMQAQGRSGVVSDGGGGIEAGTVNKANSAATAAALGGVGVNVSRESEALGIPSDLYMKLANAIEGNLAEFKRSQDVLTDVWREHTAYCQDPYHNWLGVSLAGKGKPKPEMITSQDTKDAVSTKRMDEKLF
jgi:hypothetical protein